MTVGVLVLAHPVTAQRQLLTDASHELRTPLTSLTMTISSAVMTIGVVVLAHCDLTSRSR